MQDYGPLPGFTDSSYHDDPNMTATMGGTSDETMGNVAPGSVIRVAWAIIILSLIGLWVMGALVFKKG